MRRTFKAVAALAVVVGLLALNAPPSAAETGTITGGTLTVNLTPAITEPLASTTGSCSNTLNVGFTSSLTSGHATLTIKGHFAYSGGNYLLELSYSSIHVNSTYTSGSNPTAVYGVTMGSSTGTGFTVTDVNIYPSTGVDSCTRSSDTPKCADINVAFPVITATFTGSVTHATTSVHSIAGTLVFTSPIVANIAAAGCTPPFSALNGKTATIAGMTSSVS